MKPTTNSLLNLLRSGITIVCLCVGAVCLEAQQDTAYANNLIKETINLQNKRHYAEALLKLDTAERIFLKTVGEISGAFGLVLHRKATIYQIQNFLDTAIFIYQKAIVIRKKALGDDHPDVAASYNNIGECFRLKTNYDQGVFSHKEALRIRLKAYGPVHLEVARSYYNLGLCYDNKGENDTAVDFFQKALDIRIKLLGNEDLLVARVYYDIGNSYRKRDEYEKALNCHEKALSIQQKKLNANSVDIAKTFNGLGNDYLLMGRYQQAIPFFNNSLQILIKAYGKDHADVAIAYHNIGECFKALGEYDRAIDHHKIALEIREKILKEQPFFISTSNQALGACYSKKGDFDNAINYFNKSLVVLKRLLPPEHPEIASVYSSLATCVSRMGDYDLALGLYEKSLSIRLHTLGPKHSDVAALYNNLAGVYGVKGNYNKARFYFEKALAIQLDTLGPKHPDVAISYSNLASCYTEETKYNEAIEFHNKARAIQLEVLGPNHPDLAVTYYSLGATFLEKGDDNQGVQCIKEALRIWQNVYKSKHPDIAKSLNALGTYFFSKGRFDQSLDFFQKALQANSNLESGQDSTLSKEELVKTLTKIGSIYSKSPEWKKGALAISTFTQAREVLDDYRKSLVIIGSKERLSNKFTNLYEASISASQQFHQETGNVQELRKTFDFAEQSKALSLFEAIKESGARRFAGIDSTLLNKERQLQIDLAFFERMRFEEESKPIAERKDSIVMNLGAEIFDKRRQLDSLINLLEEQFPEYKRLKYDLSTVSLDFVQGKLLNKEQTLLEYFVGDSSIFIFVIKKDECHLQEIKKDFPLKAWVEQMRTGIQSREKKIKTAEILKGLKIYTESAYLLYQKLIAPVESLLTDDLIIVPDGELGYLPFEALLAEIPGDISNCRKYPFWINDKMICYAQSATLLAEMMTSSAQKRAVKDFLAVGPFSDGDRTYSSKDTAYLVTRDKLTMLNYTKRETSESAALFGGEILLSDQATSEQFQKRAADYRILLLSTHGKGDKNLGDYSWLAFAKPGSAYDLLYVRDLYGLRINADVVVLSACETGYGELRRGEGIVGIARAFTYAGAKSLFATLWSVEDKATSDLILNFFGQLKPGIFTKKQALREAKKVLLKNDATAHPYFWAGLIGIGDMRPVQLNN